MQDATNEATAPHMAQLKQLKVLVCGGVWLYNWEVSDLSFLQNLPQLTHLNLSFNQIRKL
ncbi:MAG: leucine-rich repeat domain-containing protein [Sphingobacteriales bacterium]|nr:leucine-rich repeat domain-containing protein [Sphingobacteriales bacterium]